MSGAALELLIHAWYKYIWLMFVWDFFFVQMVSSSQHYIGIWACFISLQGIPCMNVNYIVCLIKRIHNCLTDTNILILKHSSSYPVNSWTLGILKTYLTLHVLYVLIHFPCFFFLNECKFNVETPRGRYWPSSSCTFITLIVKMHFGGLKYIAFPNICRNPASTNSHFIYLKFEKYA